MHRCKSHRRTRCTAPSLDLCESHKYPADLLGQHTIIRVIKILLHGTGKAAMLGTHHEHRQGLGAASLLSKGEKAGQGLVYMDPPGIIFCTLLDSKSSNTTALYKAKLHQQEPIWFDCPLFTQILIQSCF